MYCDPSNQPKIIKQLNKQISKRKIEAEDQDDYLLQT
jgi:hypothetical protein